MREFRQYPGSNEKRSKSVDSGTRYPFRARESSSANPEDRLARLKEKFPSLLEGQKDYKKILSALEEELKSKKAALASEQDDRLHKVYDNTEKEFEELREEFREKLDQEFKDANNTKNSKSIRDVENERRSSRGHTIEIIGECRERLKELNSNLESIKAHNDPNDEQKKDLKNKIDGDTDECKTLILELQKRYYDSLRTVEKRYEAYKANLEKTFKNAVSALTEADEGTEYIKDIIAHKYEIGEKFLENDLERRIMLLVTKHEKTRYDVIADIEGRITSLMQENLEDMKAVLETK